MPSRHRFAIALSTTALLLAQPLFALQSPLSDISIREAYFLGQRQDESFAMALDKYTRHLNPPKTGPYIQYVSFLTPFAQVLQSSHEHFAGYSAQQAQLDFLSKPESVFVTVQILLTDSYPAFVLRTANSRSDTPTSADRRPSDFWRDFRVALFTEGDDALQPLSDHGRATFNCGEHGPCILTGAIIELEFPAEAFNSPTATIQIDPPEGDQVVAAFDLSSLR